MRPVRNPRSPANCGASWPAFPAATQTQRPGVISAASIQRQIALDPVVRVAVRAERDIDDRRNRPAVQPLAEIEQIVDGVGEARRVVERRVALAILLGQRDEDAGDRRAGTHAAVSGRDAGDVRAVRSGTLRRLPQQIGGANLVRPAPLERVVHAPAGDLGAVLERLSADVRAAIASGAP